MGENSLILFDVDGTIFDSQNIIVGGFETAFHASNLIPPKREDILSTVGLSLDNAIMRMRPELEGAEIEALASNYIHAVAGKHEERLPIYPGMRQLLDRLYQREYLWLGVATGKSRRGLDPLLRANGLYDLFSIKQTADLYPSKPAPDMITEALSRFGLEKERAVIIGDTSFDVQMGQNAGIKTIGVLWGYHQSELIKSKPDQLVETADEIYDILESWEMI